MTPPARTSLSSRCVGRCWLSQASSCPWVPCHHSAPGPLGRAAGQAWVWSRLQYDQGLCNLQTQTQIMNGIFPYNEFFQKGYYRCPFNDLKTN